MLSSTLKCMYLMLVAVVMVEEVNVMFRRKTRKFFFVLESTDNEKSVAIIWLLVEAEICWEDLGVCDSYCSLECNSRHPGGLGSCNQTLAGVSSCIWYCECPPPSPQKRCNMGLGRCSSNCKDKCCADKCATKYPGGIGFCDDILGFQYSLCQCQYDC